MHMNGRNPKPIYSEGMWKEEGRKGKTEGRKGREEEGKKQSI